MRTGHLIRKEAVPINQVCLHPSCLVSKLECNLIVIAKHPDLTGPCYIGKRSVQIAFLHTPYHDAAFHTVLAKRPER